MTGVASGTESGTAGAGNGGFAAGLLDPDVEVPAEISGRRAATRRYGVYRNNVVVGLIDALKAAYPSLLAIMGEMNFARVGRHFIAAHPPRSPMMQDFGAGFAEFLAGFAPLRGSPFLADVARLERAWLEAYHAADAAPLTGADLAGLAPEAMAGLVLPAHPALAVICSDHPIGDLFAYRFGRPERGPDLAASQSALVTRPELEVRVTMVTRPQARFLGSLAAGQPLGEATEATLAAEPEFDLATALALALQSGAFVRPLA